MGRPVRPAAQRLLGTALLSGSALLLEIALTRLFSLLYFPPYVFFILSSAILGIALGAALAALRPALAAEKWLVLHACGACLSTLLLSFFAVLGAGLDWQALLFILLLLPYAFVGLALATLFSQRAAASRILYMSDLIGAGIAAVLAIPLLNSLAVVNVLLIAALGFAAAALYFYAREYALPLAVSLCLTLAALGGNAAFRFLDVDVAALPTEKPIGAALAAGGQLLQSEWDAFARTDLVDPGGGKAPRIYVDGGAASVMPALAAQPELRRDIGFFPFATEQPQRVFIVGPGAGLDVFFGLQSNAQHITAVEVNPASSALVEEWGSLHGQLYSHPAVQVIVDDGRSVLRRSAEKYDLIYLSQVITLVAERGGYALSENAIYTVDAFDEYLAHLNAEGQIALKLYDEITLTRALSTALAALERRGLSSQQALKHLMVFVDERSDPPLPLLLIGARAYSRDDALVLGAIARDVGFKPLLLPHVLVQPPLDAVDSSAESYAAIIAASEFDISAPSDDRPYFFQFERGIPQSLQPLALAAALATAAGLAAYAALWRKTPAGAPRYMPAYFALLGIGFIAIEIFAIQQTRLFLGHPTFAVTLVLAVFLVGGGIGSGLSQRIARARLERHPHLVPLLAAALLALWQLLWAALSPPLVAAPLILRALFVVISLLPLTLCMGIPFPQALSRAGQLGSRQVAAGWAVNGLTTVAGTVAAVILSITIGFAAVGILGGAAYLLAACLLLILQRQAEA